MSTYNQIKEEGRFEAKKEFIKRAYLLGISIQSLAKISGFTIEEVNIIIGKKDKIK